MKCPNCGLEVVIATDLCPWCGYKYSFDGSIPPKEPVYEPGEEPSHVRRRREREHEESEHWTRAGTFTEADARERKEQAERFSRAKKPVRPPRAQASGLGTAWLNALSSAVIPVNFLIYLYTGVTALTGLTGSLDGWYYSIFSWVAPAAAVRGLVYTACAILIMLSSRMLKERRWLGVVIYLSAVLVPAVVNLVYQVLFMTYFSYYYDLAALVLGFTATVIYAALNSVYFKRRREMFS